MNARNCPCVVVKFSGIARLVFAIKLNIKAKELQSIRGLQLFLPAPFFCELYQVKKITTEKGDVIPVVISPGGGHCLWIRLLATAQ